MIQKVLVENYKSIQRQSFPLGRLTVLIGENGAGKSNVLEALTFYSAALADRLDNEFLASRGIRTTEPRFTRSAFMINDDPIVLQTKDDQDDGFRVELRSVKDVNPRRKWDVQVSESIQSKNSSFSEDFLDSFLNDQNTMSILSEAFLSKEQRTHEDDILEHLKNHFTAVISQMAMHRSETSFLVFSPAYETMRTFEQEGQILPVGTKGEGLLSHLRFIEEQYPDIYTTILDKLQLLGWFSGLQLHVDADDLIKVEDRYLNHKELFDLRSVNEGFFYMLFYYTLLLSPHTPDFFAIDNVDASLNPKMCRQLIKDMAEITKENGKQVILTTHNPAVLDGLNLHDAEQRLLVVKRDEDGHTIVQNVPAPKESSVHTIKLSEAFLKGYLGGLPESF